MPINFNVNCIFIFLREKISVYNKIHKIVQSHRNAQNAQQMCSERNSYSTRNYLTEFLFFIPSFFSFFLHTEHSYLSKGGICVSKFHVKVKCGFAKSVAVFKLIKKTKQHPYKAALINQRRMYWQVLLILFISNQYSDFIFFSNWIILKFKVKCKQDGLSRT